MGLQRSDALVNGSLLEFVGVILEFEHQAALLVFLELCEILVERRNLLAVAQTDVCEVSSIVIDEIHTCYALIVED